MKQIKVPQRFYLDHVNRDLPAGKIIKSTSKHFIIEVDQATFDELLNDAQFYADASYVIEQMGREYIGLVRSAQSTVRALQAVA